MLQQNLSYISNLNILVNYIPPHFSYRRERIHGGVEVLEQEERGDDDENQEECVVVEDGEGGGLVVSDLVLLPQNSGQEITRTTFGFYLHVPG